jgi:hypothetical protein
LKSHAHTSYRSVCYAAAESCAEGVRLPFEVTACTDAEGPRGLTFQIYHTEKLTRALLPDVSSSPKYPQEYEHFLCAGDGGKFVQVVRGLAADFEFAVVMPVDLHYAYKPRFQYSNTSELHRVCQGEDILWSHANLEHSYSIIMG